MPFNLAQVCYEETGYIIPVGISKDMLLKEDNFFDLPPIYVNFGPELPKNFILP